MGDSSLLSVEPFDPNLVEINKFRKLTPNLVTHEPIEFEE